jgi:glutathione peroxidase
MKTILALLLLVFPFQDKTSNIYQFKMKAIDGTPIDFSVYKGKKLLIVNVASKCGNTPQYADLQKLHEQYGGKVTILGFPANNFGGQEPGTNIQIQEFCTQNYGVTFQMFEKISVKGDDRDPLYAWLAEKTGKEPTWNFSKYLVDETGTKVEYIGPKVNPLDASITASLK